MSNPENGAERHENVWLLLPWYVNGTLEAAERRLVDDHLAACPNCLEELARSKLLATALRARQDSAPSPHPIQLARLMERIEASEASLASDASEASFASEASEAGDASGTGERGFASLPADLADRRRGEHDRRGRQGLPGARLLGSTPRPVRWALAGQLAAMLLLAAALAFGPARRLQSASSAPASAASARNADYITLSAPAAVGSSTAAVRPQIRLVFVETASEKQMRDVLLCTRGRLVDGPSPLGAYTLELPAPTSATAAPADSVSLPPGSANAETPASSARTAAAREAAPAPSAPRAALAEAAPDSVGTVLAYLRAQPIVRFAEPVAGTVSPSPSPARPGVPAGEGTNSPAPPRP
ncbi:MAG TPA: anti-sigma factor [Thermoanaerobaculia bacterium]|jgi:hypothetical protein|nr:anti-sigma factor [Thermoanaerobaculia bacterium]